MLRKIATWILLALVCNVVVKILLLLDLNKESYSHLPGPCTAVIGVDHGAYDIAFVKNGSVIISSGQNTQSPLPANVPKRGKLLFFDMNKTELLMPFADEIKILGDSFTPDDFNPFGISVWSSKGRTMLYAVNHRNDGSHTIESFLFKKEEKTLTHSKTIRHDLIFSATDVLAVGPDRLFITNDHFFRLPWLRLLETYLMINLGNLVFFDGQKAQIVDSWLLSPTGLGLSKDKKFLYVSCPLEESIKVYKLKPDNSVVKHLDLALLTSPTNLFVDPDSGDIWTGCQPIMHKYLQHFSNHSIQSPSQVLKIRMQEKHDSWTVTEAYANDGRSLSASSIAVAYNKHILVGSAFDKLLFCQIANPDTL